MKFVSMSIASCIGLAGMANLALAGCIAPGPAPVLGALGGPWGLLAAAACYGGYKVYRRLR